MNRAAMPICAFALLAACGKSSVDERNATPEQVAEAVASSDSKDLKFTPGRWQTKLAVLKIDAPGMPADAAAAMNRAIGKERSSSTCLSREAAAKPAAEFFGNGSKNCRYDHFTMGGGKLDAKMRCSEGRTEVLVTMNGDYSPTHYTMKMETSAPGGETGPVTVRMAVQADHAGACRGDEQGKS